MKLSLAPDAPVTGGHLAATASTRRLAARRPVLVVLAWFFTVGQLIAFVPRFAEHLGAPAPPTEPFIIASTWVGLLLPAAAVTWATDGRAGLSALVARTVRWRVPAGWYAVPLLAVPGGIVGLQAADQGLPTLAAGQAAVDVVTHFLVPLVVVLVTVNLAEEVVWTGFVQTRLRAAGRSPLGAASIVAPLFALQHLSLLAGGPGEVTALLVLLTGLALPFRLLLGWLLDRTGSLLLVGLVHASGNAAALGSLGVVGLVPAWFGQDGQSLLVLAALGLVVAPVAVSAQPRSNDPATLLGERGAMNTTTLASPLHRPNAGSAGRWPLATFVSVALPVGWVLLSVPLLVDLPLAPFVLATTALGLVLPALLLARSESAGGARALLHDALRLPRPLWLLVPAALAIPVGTWAGAAMLGVDTSPSPSFLLSLALANVLSSLVVINLWEEMVWAGFVQRRASARWGYVAGSVVTALLFTGIHLPLSLYDADGAGDVAVNIGFMVVAGIGLRLLIGAFDVWGRGSILTLGLVHATFNASSELVEADADWVRYAVTLTLGLAAAALLRGRR